MRTAIKHEEFRISSGLDYLGQGDSNGQAALASGSQCIAPMSRDFSSCHSGARTYPVALDGVISYVAEGTLSARANPAIQVTYHVLKKLFSGNGSGAGCTQYQWSDSPSDIGDLSTGVVHFNNKDIKLYRMDDASGDTDILKSKLGISAFCTSSSVDITIVRDDNVGCGGVSGQCVTCSGMSATDCLAQKIAFNEFALGFGSLGATTEPSCGQYMKKLSVSAEVTNPTGGTYYAPTATNIRRLTTVPATAYPLSHPVYINHDINNSCSLGEVFFKNISLSSEACVFENTLVSYGFVACKSGGPRTDPDLDCQNCPGITYACP